MATIGKRGGKGPYIVRWFDHEGHRRERSARTTDLRTAERLAAKWEGDSMLRRERVIDPRHDRYGAHEALPLADHQKAWKAALTGKGNSRRHVALVTARAAWVIELACAKRITIGARPTRRASVAARSPSRAAARSSGSVATGSIRPHGSARPAGGRVVGEDPSRPEGAHGGAERTNR